MIHITTKYKCKDTEGDEHIVLHVVCWDQANNVNIRKDMIEMPGHDIINEDGVKTGFYPTCYMTASQLDIELDFETKIDL